MVKRPDGMSAFEFSVLSSLRAAQLNRGCTPRVECSALVAVTAQHEVAERKVVRAPEPPESDGRAPQPDSRVPVSDAQDSPR
jgi:hypothetical protein